MPYLLQRAEPYWQRLWTRDGSLPHLPERLTQWGAPAAVALFAGVLRFWNLGTPRTFVFDETYYAKDAWSLLHQGYEGNWTPGADPTILANTRGLPSLLTSPEFVVHPPAGKWAIALGEWAFGLNPFGWRFAVALLGTLSVLLLCRIGRRLTGSTALGCLAGALMSLDGLHFVMSRVALLDMAIMFWVLAAFGCLLIDRDKAHRRLARAFPGEVFDARDAAGRVLGLRPWRLAAGVCLGLACATKWNGIYFLAGFLVLTLTWDTSARRAAGAIRPTRSVLRRDTFPAFCSLVLVATVVYVASWAGWFATGGGYDRTWAADHLGQPGFFAPLRSLWFYHQQMWQFHTHMVQPHPYQSEPWTWLLLTRPVAYFWNTPTRGQAGCQTDSCAQEVLALGTPILWAAACIALLYLLYRALRHRDGQAGAVLCAVAAGYLPWFLYAERTIFQFYAVVLVPFLCLAVTMLVRALVGTAQSNRPRRVLGAALAGMLTAAIAWNFFYFLPLYTGQTITYGQWAARMWLPTWV